MSLYRVCVDGDQDVIDDARVVKANTLEEAATEYVRLNLANLGYPDEVDLFVKRDGVKAPPVKFIVYATQEVRFTASQVDR